MKNFDTDQISAWGKSASQTDFTASSWLSGHLHSLEAINAMSVIKYRLVVAVTFNVQLGTKMEAGSLTSWLLSPWRISSSELALPNLHKHIPCFYTL